MAAVKKTTKQNGYGEKQTVRIITVDKKKRRVECAMRDGAMIFAAVWETGTIFRWPEIGEIWTVRMDTGIWRLDQIVQSIIAEHESEATPKTLAELPEGDTRIIGEKIHANDIDAKDLTVNTVIATSGLYTDYGIVTSLPITTVKGSVCTFKAATGIYWRLIYTGEATYPWAKMGGPSLRTVELTTRETKSATAQTTGAPFITLPLNMEFRARYGAAFANLKEPGLQQLYTILFVNGVEKDVNATAATDITGLVATAQFEGNTIDRGSNPQTALATQKVETRYHTQGTITGGFYELFIEIDPLRVG